MKKLLDTFVLMVLLLLGCQVYAQLPPEKSAQRTTICDLISHPDQFAGKRVIVHAQFSVNWEGGPWVWDESCKAAIQYVEPNIPLPAQVWVIKARIRVPANYTEFRLIEDAEYRKFQEFRKYLCNGLKALCDFQSIEADFTGVFLAAEAATTGEEDSPSGGIFVVTQIHEPKGCLEESMLQVIPMPDHIPDNE